MSSLVFSRAVEGEDSKEVVEKNNLKNVVEINKINVVLLKQQQQNDLSKDKYMVEAMKYPAFKVVYVPVLNIEYINTMKLEAELLATDLFLNKYRGVIMTSQNAAKMLKESFIKNNNVDNDKIKNMLSKKLTFYCMKSCKDVLDSFLPSCKCIGTNSKNATELSNMIIEDINLSTSALPLKTGITRTAVSLLYLSGETRREELPNRLNEFDNSLLILDEINVYKSTIHNQIKLPDSINHKKMKSWIVFFSPLGVKGIFHQHLENVKKWITSENTNIRFAAIGKATGNAIFNELQERNILLRTKDEKEDTIRNNVLIASEPRVEVLYREMNSMQLSFKA
jgi:uroporphyrinogen-III synthase